MALVLKTPPLALPVSAARLRDHLRLDDASQDDLLSLYLGAAVEHGQNLTRRQFVQAGYELVLDEFPAAVCLELPRPPLVAVDSITYLDAAGASQTLTGYLVDTDSTPGRVCLAPVQSWPETYAAPGAVRIAYAAGWPLVAEGNPTTPAGIQAWLLLRAAGLYANPEPVIVGRIVTSLPRDFTDALLDPYTVPLVV